MLISSTVESAPAIFGDNPIPLETRIIMDWRRFSSGLWRVPVGDIVAAYSAHILPRIKVFSHEGRLFTNLLSHFSQAFVASMDCYQLLPLDGRESPQPGRYSYEGTEVIHGGSRFRLGPKVVFTAADPTPAEWRTLLRVLYADGGYFAAHCTYREFLAERFSPNSANARTAHAEESARCQTLSMPLTQEEMKRFLDEGTTDAPKPADRPQQKEFVY